MKYLVNIKILIRKFLYLTKEVGVVRAIKKGFSYVFKNVYKAKPFSTSYKPSNTQRRGVLCPFSRPVVSILIVSYNSGQDLKKLIKSINLQTYKNIEVILVENGSEDTQQHLGKVKFPTKFIHSNNIGFAAANNLALSHSKGECICLVNPDTILDCNLIYELLNSLTLDPLVVVAVPKILFMEKFVDIEIESSKEFTIDLSELEKNLTYKKYFIRHGDKVQNDVSNFALSVGGIVRISLPVDDSKVTFKAFKTNPDQKLIFRFCSINTNNDLFLKKYNSVEKIHTELVLSKESIWWGENVLNNAGSSIRDGNPYDRGFAEYDYGAGYRTPEYVEALCGCIAMIDPFIFLQRSIFIDEFFAYFEDSELSLWVNRQGVHIKYNPNAIVRHYHSSIISENSIIWEVLTNRSRTIYNQIMLNHSSKLRVTDSKYEKINGDLKNTLLSYDKSINNRDLDVLIAKKRPSLGLYNSYWNTYGGGERHALSIAKILSSDYDVYLISEEDFDSTNLQECFNIHFKFRKIITQVDEVFTENFDVFLNSTFCSSLVSNANKSVYITSFPHKEVSPEFLGSYLFLHNSNYTKKWAKRFWGEHYNELLFPILEMEVSSVEKFDRKESEIIRFISIGRFTQSGHNKQQDFIIEAFKCAQKSSNTNAELFLCGSVNNKSKEDMEYVHSLEKRANKSIHIETNITFENLESRLLGSDFYLHATGVGVDSDASPEKFEHFGITIVEALSHGVYPIAFNVGGPAQTIKDLGVGSLYKDKNELIAIIVESMNQHKRRIKVSNDILKPYVDNNINTIKKLEKFISE
jgi:GT2 family glycosyltransferase